MLPRHLAVGQGVIEVSIIRLRPETIEPAFCLRPANTREESTWLELTNDFSEYLFDDNR